MFSTADTIELFKLGTTCYLEGTRTLRQSVDNWSGPTLRGSSGPGMSLGQEKLTGSWSY